MSYEIDTYNVMLDADGKKIIRYNGYSWERDPMDVEYGLQYAITESDDCYIPVGEDNFARAQREFDRSSQSQYDLTLSEVEAHVEFWKNGYAYLPMDCVDQDTPCGPYWF